MNKPSKWLTNASHVKPMDRRIIITFFYKWFCYHQSCGTLFCWPFPTAEYLFVAIDAYSHFSEVEIIHSTSAKATIPKLERMLPQANSEAETIMKPLTKAIRSSHAERRDWRKDLYLFLLNYWAIPHSTTGFAPSELLFNRNIKTKLPQLTVSNNKSDIDFKVQRNDKQAKEQMKNYVDKKSHGQGFGY